MNQDIDPGSKFPDLLKAALGLKLDDLIKGILNQDKEFFELAQEKKEKLLKQKSIDLKSFISTQSGAIDRGNTNSCQTKEKFEEIAVKQASNVNTLVIPGTGLRSPLGVGKNTIKLPKTRSITPTSGERSNPPSLARTKLNQGIGSAVDSASHFIESVIGDNLTDKARRNMQQFVKAQAGQRGTSIGDRAIVFTANGTPMFGDSFLDKNLTENVAANQATGSAPISKVPAKIEQGKPISPKPLQQQPRANVAPKSDTTANLLVLGGIGAAVTAVLFLFQYVLMFVGFILQVSSVTSTITNIAGSFVAILNNIGSLFGLGEGLIDPLSRTFDSILNSTFGKEKVDYAKYQFAKISAVYVAGQNLINKVSGLNNSIGSVTADNANNTSKIGNALKAMGMLATGEGWMREDNKISTGVGKVGDSLTNISGLASSLTDITNDVKTAKQSLATLDKEQAEKEKIAKEGEYKATVKHADPEIPDLHILRGHS